MRKPGTRVEQRRRYPFAKGAAAPFAVERGGRVQRASLAGAFGLVGLERTLSLARRSAPSIHHPAQIRLRIRIGSFQRGKSLGFGRVG